MNSDMHVCKLYNEVGDSAMMADCEISIDSNHNPKST
jgi:hypothetical protein